MPLVHVAWGLDPFTGKPKVARGIIAVGPIALGAVAIGPMAVGLIAVGQISVALVLAAGQVAAGIGAFGQFALGAPLAAGQVAAATVAHGQLVWQGAWAQVGLAAAWLLAASALVWAWWRGGRSIGRLLGRRQSIAVTEPGSQLVFGRIHPLKTVEAPVSHRACVAYDVRRVHHDRPTKTERACEDFVLDDGTGRARVLAGDAILLLEPRRRVTQAVENRVVAQAGGAPTSRGVVRAVGTAIERVLLPGDEVVVAGHVLRNITATGLHLAVHGGATGPVLVTNRDLDEVRAEAQIWLLLAAILAASAVAALASAFV